MRRKKQVEVQASYAETRMTPLTERAEAFRAAWVSLSSPDTCWVCGEPVRLMIYRGTRVCSQRCETAGRYR